MTTMAAEIRPNEENAVQEVTEQDDDPDQECRVYVGHLTPQANETDVQAFFRPFGVIRHIWIARKPPGFAFVTYSKVVAAQRAIDAIVTMDDPSILGQTIKCQLSKGKESDASMADTASHQHNETGKSRKRVRSRKGETFKQKKERKLKTMERDARRQ
ncbi:Aste57867_11671 [Aphanomyces stellatus]|uniref:Aste57867_11671 protein n=1 Tax=Aphanomyces stellatus TaxID=120398 RepID=A0A485KU38_9STRA|nr:hypothetical protein As57867_011628 [Aphanomyces stellatus]VFT88529.1 Aste57867_11671 [Aphanomyces stellatus]